MSALLLRLNPEDKACGKVTGSHVPSYSSLDDNDPITKSIYTPNQYSNENFQSHLVLNSCITIPTCPFDIIGHMFFGFPISPY